MTDTIIRDDTAVTVTVPAVYADRFKRELLGDLGAAADNLQEGTVWAERGEGDPDRLTASDLPRMHAIGHLYEQASGHLGGDLKLTGSRQRLADAVQGCVQEIVDHMSEQGDAQDFDAMRSRVAELTAWLDLAEEIA